MRTFEEINKKRLENLNKTLKNIHKSPMYRDKYNFEIEELNDLSELRKFEITTKEELRAYSPSGNLAADMKKVVQYHETSGTTGKSISTWLTNSDHQVWCDEMESVALKFNENDILAIRFPYALSFPAHIIQDIVKKAGGVAIPIDSRGVVTPHTRVINLMLKLKITTIACLPLELIMLAETAKLMGYDPKEDFKSLRGFYTIGELLTKERKKQIENIWGVPVYDNYGLTECGVVATACENGHLHVVDENFIIEILDPETLEPVPNGEKGIITISNINFEGNPLIRYYTGDIGRIVDGNTCECGKSSEIIEHFGRIYDIIKIGDQEILMQELQDAILKATGDKVSPFWMVSFNKKRLTINFEESDDREVLDKKAAEQEISNLLGCECKIKLNKYGELFDREKLLKMQLTIKPKYIADYSQTSDYPCTLNDLLKGYGTF
ncbi:phenylacetate--CoA ligase family protein [Vallitalea maricola]|uniref:Phenylacetate--CoA ligase family protein n=1 Tax=Vallitalea maricola TaxID=3074433 RepID=A0ACB5UFD9_9FIRM|nr:phenylacetate--CoA ligase family protein [Vallitalea sp. AN17-2]